MASKSEFEARIERCIEYRKTPTASLVGWIDILSTEYDLSDHQAKRDYAKAGEILESRKLEERKAYLASIEAQLDVIHKEAVDGIVQIKKDNQNTKKMTLSFIKQLQTRLDSHPEEINNIIPILNKLIDSINKTNYNESKVIEIMGKWRGLEQPTQQINIQNNYKLNWGNDPGLQKLESNDNDWQQKM